MINELLLTGSSSLDLPRTPGQSIFATLTELGYEDCDEDPIDAYPFTITAVNITEGDSLSVTLIGELAGNQGDGELLVDMELTVSHFVRLPGIWDVDERNRRATITLIGDARGN